METGSQQRLEGSRPKEHPVQIIDTALSLGFGVMGNAVASGVSSSHSPSALLRLRRGKKSTGCPCFLSEHASTWEALTLHDKFRPYVLRHLLDEGFICSLLEHGEREHALTACEGVLYYTVSGRFFCHVSSVNSSWHCNWFLYIVNVGQHHATLVRVRVRIL